MTWRACGVGSRNHRLLGHPAAEEARHQARPPRAAGRRAPTAYEGRRVPDGVEMRRGRARVDVIVAFHTPADLERRRCARWMDKAAGL